MFGRKKKAKSFKPSLTSRASEAFITFKTNRRSARHSRRVKRYVKGGRKGAFPKF